MKTVSLFSGIGGLDLGLEDAGHEIILQVESDPHCVQVLQHHFPGRALRRDVAELTELPPETELLAAGFPCPDVSSSNLSRPGLRHGTQTGLCSHVFRLLAKTRVPWVLLENVVGLLHWHAKDDPPQPPAISLIVAELEKLGYRWAHRVVGLTGFGIPQRRRRVFVVASIHGDPRDILLAPQAVCLGQCVEMHRRRADVGDGDDDDDDEDDNVFDKPDQSPPRVAEGPLCVECALEAVASPTQVAGAFETALSSGGGGLPGNVCKPYVCSHKTRECYECFRTPPFVEPVTVVASVDLGEKRHGPMLDELFTLTTANGKRMCIVENVGDGKGKRAMLHVEDAERLMGLPGKWTEPAYPLRAPGKPKRAVDYGYASLVTRNGVQGGGGGGGDYDNDPSEQSVRNQTRDFQISQNDFNLATAKRFEKLGIAVAVPQARWIGERLMNPYDLKFARAGDAVRFSVPVPGGPDVRDRRTLDTRDRRVVRRVAGGVDDDGSPDPVLANGVSAEHASVTAVAAGRARPASDTPAPNTCPTQAMDDALAEARAAFAGWPDAAYNVTPVTSSKGGGSGGAGGSNASSDNSNAWRNRMSLPGCGDSPVIRGFMPLGVFLRRTICESQACSLEQALGYVKRLRLEHVYIEPFVAHGLGETKPPRGEGTNAKKGRAGGVTTDQGNGAGPSITRNGMGGDGGRAGEDITVDPEKDPPEEGPPAGRVVWAPTKVGRGDAARAVYWPSLALHAHDDRDAIPDTAFDVMKPTETPDTHVLVVYFGDKTYEWCPKDALLNYSEHQLALSQNQPAVVNQKRFQNGLEQARAWHADQVTRGLTPAVIAQQHARQRAENDLRRAVGAQCGDGDELPPPASCGVCRNCVAKTETQKQTQIPRSDRHKPRAAAASVTYKGQCKGVGETKNTTGTPFAACPQIAAIVGARKGHVGSSLSLLRENAIGTRVKIYWANERVCFVGTVFSFDPESLTHGVKYEDGDVEPTTRLWKEVVHLAVPEDTEAERESVGLGSGSARVRIPRATTVGNEAGASARSGLRLGKRARRDDDDDAGAGGNVSEQLVTEENRPRRGPGRPPLGGRGRGRGRGARSVVG